MPHKRTESNEYWVHLPALWKFLLSHRLTVGLVLSGTAIAAISTAMQALLLYNHPQPQDSSAAALALSARAIVIDPATQAVTLEAIDSD
jgi:hypothetical protein